MLGGNLEDTDKQPRDGPSQRHMDVVEIIPSSEPPHSQYSVAAGGQAGSELPVKGAIGLHVLFM